MMKLVLFISDDDDAVKEGGPLAMKTWKIGHIAISVLSGYDKESRWENNTPCLYVHAINQLWHPPDYRKSFDLAAFESALNEAKAEVNRMEEYIAAKIEELYGNHDRHV